MIIRLLIFSCFFISFYSYGIYNLKTKQEFQVGSPLSKNWLLVTLNCSSCDSALLELKTLCQGQKPPSQNLGFFVIGFNYEAVRKKLAGFHSDYDVYLGSASEFYNAYKLQGSPSLLIKENKKNILGVTKIIKKLKKMSHFCKV